MIRRSVPGTLVLPVLVLLSSGACGGDDNTDVIDPTPIINNITERFEDTIGVNHARTHSFASNSGTMVASVTTLTPDSTAVIGVSLGIWNGAACQLVVTNDAISQGGNVTAQASAPGSFCVRVSDTGRVTEPTTYVVEVVHREP